MKTYKVELTEEFIKEAHEVACPDWKIKIKDLVPKAFEDEFKIGEWYRHKSMSWLVCVTKTAKNHKVGYNYGYGFTMDGSWKNPMMLIDYKDWKPATDKEVEEALIKEAKKRGFVEGVKYNYPDKPTIEARQIIGNDFNYLPHLNALCNNHNGIFHEGVWAEPLKVNPALKRIEEIKAELKELKKKL